MDCSRPGFPVHHYFPEFAQSPLSRWYHSTITSSVTIFSSCPQSCPVSGYFSSELALHIRWPKYWSLNFSISPSNDYSGLISFRIDWFDLLACPRDSQESFLAPQLESIKSLVLSLLYGPTLISVHYWKIGKNINLTTRTFLSKVMPPFCNMLSRFVIVFIPKSKCLLILQLQSSFVVILEPSLFHFFLIYLPWSDRTKGHDVSFLNV